MSQLMLFSSEEGAGEPSAKKVKIDDSLDGGMKDLAKAKVTEVCVYYFLGLISGGALWPCI